MCVQKKADATLGGGVDKLKDTLFCKSGTRKEDQPASYKLFYELNFERNFVATVGVSKQMKKNYWRSYTDTHFYDKGDEGLAYLRAVVKFYKDCADFNLPGQERYKKKMLMSDSNPEINTVRFF